MSDGRSRSELVWMATWLLASATIAAALIAASIFLRLQWVLPPGFAIARALCPPEVSDFMAVSGCVASGGLIVDLAIWTLVVYLIGATWRAVRR